MPLSQLDIYNITLGYYSKFVCADITKARPGPAAHFICTAKRDLSLKGYGCSFFLYILQRPRLCMLAYSPLLLDFMDTLKGCPPNQIIAACDAEYHLKKMQLFIFEHEKVRRFGDAKTLTPGDYPLYEAFFRETHKLADPDGWLYEYYSEKVEKGLFTGYFKDGRLVSVCDPPDMPYMEGAIQHTGIMTLAEERRRGYGRLTAALATHNLLKNGICPQWECEENNTASANLARSIGYTEYAKAYVLER